MPFSWSNAWNGITQNLCCAVPSTTETQVVEEDYEGNANDNNIPYFWHRNIENHCYGQYSMAVLQGNQVVEDQSQVEVADGEVFCGIYDGHGGPRASRYLVENLYNTYRGLAQERGCIGDDAILKAFETTEARFLDIVEAEFHQNPNIAGHGSCCLVGVLSGRRLYYANLGDSRAVLGLLDDDGNMIAQPLTQDHNVNVLEERRQYRALHPENEVGIAHGSWRIKSTIQVTRSIGDGNFKREHLALDESHPRFHVRRPASWPLLDAEPSMERRDLNPADKFVIFASDGLWEHISNYEAVQVVHKGTRQGAARRLVKNALRKKAEKTETTYDVLKMLDIEHRRKFLDDISVIVLFVDDALLKNPRVMTAPSVKGFDYEPEEVPEDWIRMVDAEGDLFS